MRPVAGRHLLAVGMTRAPSMAAVPPAAWASGLPSRVNAAMAAVAAFLLAARLAPASPVRWRVPQALEVMFGPRYLTGLSARSRRQK